MKVNLPDGRTIGVKVSGLAHAEGSTDPHAGAGRISRSGEDARSFHSEDAALKRASIRNSLRAIESPATTPHQGPNEAGLDLIHRNS
jgi:hypothetical protein